MLRFTWLLGGHMICYIWYFYGRRGHFSWIYLKLKTCDNKDMQKKQAQAHILARKKIAKMPQI